MLHSAVESRYPIWISSHSWDTCNTLRWSVCTTWLDWQTVSKSDAQKKDEFNERDTQTTAVRCLWSDCEMASHLSLTVLLHYLCWLLAARSVALISRWFLISITDNTEHCCFHKGRSWLTVNNFCDVCDLIFLVHFLVGYHRRWTAYIVLHLNKVIYAERVIVLRVKNERKMHFLLFCNAILRVRHFYVCHFQSTPNFMPFQAVKNFWNFG